MRRRDGAWIFGRGAAAGFGEGGRGKVRRAGRTRKPPGRIRREAGRRAGVVRENRPEKKMF